MEVVTVSSALADLLREYDVGIDEAEFLADLRARLAAARSPADTGLTEGEQDFLRRHGGSEGRAVLDGDDLTRRRRRTARAVRGATSIGESTLSSEEAAALLGKSRSQVSRDLHRGRLHGTRLGTHWRIPRWQFADGAALPGLPVVLAAVPPELHPAVLEGFMLTPQDELDGLTPVRHLLGGGDPGAVARLIADLDR